jgi:flagellar biosynthesis/type III secretory pathway protein FliH
MRKKVIKSKDLEKRLGLEEKVKKGPGASKVDIMSGRSGGVLNKKTLEAKVVAQTVIEEAKKEAEKIRSEAKGLLDQVGAELTKAKERGYGEGREEGLASVTEQVVAFEKLKEEFNNNAEENIIRLVMMIAEKVIGKIVQEQGEAIKSVVKQALESALGDRILVKLNPADYKTVTEAESEFTAMLDRTKRLTFKEEEVIARGGCVVETEVGTIDARLETQLKAIRKALEL